MIVPDTIQMRATMFGDGARGMALQVSRNNEHGIQLEARREKHGAPWIETWTSDFLPDREFKTFRELRDALRAETLTVPWKMVVLKVEPRGPRDSAKCWTCRGEYQHDVRVKTGWRPGDESIIPTCAADLEKVKADPAAAIEARRKWVSEHPIKL